jgi:hypothetical protein
MEIKNKKDTPDIGHGQCDMRHAVVVSGRQAQAQSVGLMASASHSKY